jgi:hypothetical protein
MLHTQNFEDFKISGKDGSLQAMVAWLLTLFLGTIKRGASKGD